MNYSTSLIGGDSIRFIRYRVFGFSLYQPLGGMNWAPVLGLRQGSGRLTRPAY